MDKLEFDARLAHLERRVALLSALALGLLFAVGAGLLLMTVRSTASERPAVMPPTPSATVATATVAAPPAPLADVSEGSVGYLTRRLDDLEALREKSLLTSLEFQEQKRQILEKTVRSADLKSELEHLGALRDRDVLTSLEFQAVKEKLLKAEPRGTKGNP